MKLFEYKAEIPREDGEGNEPVVLLLKPITEVPIGILRRNRRNNEAQMWDMLEWALSDDQMGLFDRLPAPQLQKIMVAWQNADDDGVDAGESDASSASSTDTGRRSKQTSSTTDSD